MSRRTRPREDVILFSRWLRGECELPDDFFGPPQSGGYCDHLGRPLDLHGKSPVEYAKDTLWVENVLRDIP